ncbi:MAG: WecB/TagA/CpsF family glycosyltransferase, partial [Bacillota bacterium]
PEAVREAAGMASRRARVVGFHHGFFPEDEEPALVEHIRSCAPGLILSGMGIPRDQAFAARWRECLPPGVCLAVGGGLDVLAGRVRRAPEGVRRLGLEWLYRLAVSPGRWRRQLALPRFAWNVLCRRILL